MTSEQIRAKTQKAKEKLAVHDAKRLVLEAQLLALQHQCPHKNIREWPHYDYVGGSDHHWICDDCGAHKIT